LIHVNAAKSDPRWDMALDQEAPMTRLWCVATISFAACALTACAGLTEIEPFRETSCIESVHVSLVEAVQAAETEGGKALDAAYREPQEMGCLVGKPGYYDVSVLNGGQLSLFSVDAASRRVGPRLEQDMFDSLGAQGLELAFEGTSGSRVPVSRNASITLLQAVRIAEKQGGKAMEARIDRKDGQAGYLVKLVDHGHLSLTWVDGNGGTSRPYEEKRVSQRSSERERSSALNLLRSLFVFSPVPLRSEVQAPRTPAAALRQ
jgi:hypothetical protein